MGPLKIPDGGARLVGAVSAMARSASWRTSPEQGPVCLHWIETHPVRSSPFWTTVRLIVEGHEPDLDARYYGIAVPSGSLARLAIVGAGGLGSFVVPEAAHLGVGAISVIDIDVVTESSLNRLVGAIPADVPAATPKVEVAMRVARAIDPDLSIEPIKAWLTDERARAAIVAADAIIGCLDDDYARLQLNEIASDARRPLIDLASDVVDEGRHYGGRVVIALPERRCLSCLGVLDPDELALGALSPEQRAARDRIYGIKRDLLDARDASVVTINGVVASLGMTELMVLLTGLRSPRATLTYGHVPRVGVTAEPADQGVGHRVILASLE